MKNFAWTLLAALSLSAVGCAGEGEVTTESDQGALEQGQSCGRGAGRQSRATNAQTLSSRIDEANVKLAAAPRDPAAVPTGAPRNSKYLSALELKDGGKFTAKLNTGTRLKGTFTLSAPRCRANFEMLTLDPVGEDAVGLVFKVVRGHDESAPNRYSFDATAEGWTIFNMTIDAPEQATPETGCNCDDLPRPRCIGAYVCEENACVWRSPVGGPSCG